MLLVVSYRVEKLKSIAQHYLSEVSVEDCQRAKSKIHRSPMDLGGLAHLAAAYKFVTDDTRWAL